MLGLGARRGAPRRRRCPRTLLGRPRRNRRSIACPWRTPYLRPIAARRAHCFAGGAKAGRRLLDLTGADLRGASLAEGKLDRATLARVRADLAVFDGASMKGAELSEAALERARFDGADPRRADLSG